MTTIRDEAHSGLFHRAMPPALPVRVATTANITIATALNAGDSIDGVSLAADDRVLVKNQTSAVDNGIYLVGTTPERTADMFEGLAAMGSRIYVIAGTANGGKVFRNTNTTLPTIGVDNITFVESTSAPSGTAGGDLSGSYPNPDVVNDSHAHTATTLPGFIGCKAYNSTTQSVTAGTPTAALFNTEVFDSGTIHDTSTNTSRFVVPVTGFYHVLGTGQWDSSVSTACETYIRRNGTTSVLGTAAGNSGSVSSTSMALTVAVISLTAADYIEFMLLAGGGGSKLFGHTTDDAYRATLTIYRIW